MKFLELELSGFKRISLTGVTRLVYKPVHKIQIITGPNGSGKSSILGELSPFPSDKKDYDIGGMKKIVIEHNGSIYTLINSFGKPNKYSFVRDGEELNLSANKTTQISLAQTYFGLDSKMWEIVTGKSTFSSMSVSQRRDWFTKASGKDHTYAEYVYKTLSEALRSNMSVFKHISASRADVEKNSVSEEHTRYLKEYRKDLLSLLEELEIYRRHNKETLDDIQNRINSHSIELVKNKERLLSLLQRRDVFISIDDLENRKKHISSKIHNITGQLQSVWDILEKKRELRDGIRLTNTQNEAALVDKIQTLERRINTTISIEGITIDEIKTYVRVFDDVYERLSAIRDDLLDTETIEEYLNSRESLVDDLVRFKNKLRELEIKESSISRLREVSELQKVSITCPKCTYNWKQNIGDLLYINDIASMETDIASIKKKITTNEEIIKDIDKRLRALRDLREIRRTIQMPSIWRYLGVDSTGNIDIGLYVSRVVDLPSLREELSSTLSMYEDLAKYKEWLKKYKDSDSIDRVETDIEDLERKEKELSNKKIDLTYELKDIEKRIALQKDIDLTIDRLKKTITYISKTKRTGKEIAFQRALGSMIRDVKEKIHEIDDEISISQKIHDTLTRMDSELLELSEKRELLEKLLNVLSPKDGLIGEMISDGMLSILEDMNSIIRKIWRYKLEVLPCIPEEGDVSLSYRFPVKIEDHISEDVSKTSSSMQEIINLAFRITISSRLGLDQYPLFLDEFGRSFDSLHRKKAYETIYNELGTSEEFTQVYMVSHYLEDFGYYKECDTIQLGKEALFGERNLSTVLEVV